MDEITQASSSEYMGQVGQTRQETIHYTCDTCGFLFGGRIYRGVNVATDPGIGEHLEQGTLNQLICPDCGAICVPQIELVYHDPGARILALILPDSMRHRELESRAKLLLALEKDPAVVPEYVKPAAVVFGASGLLRLQDEGQVLSSLDRKRRQKQTDLQETLVRRQAELEDRESALLAREEDLQAKQEDLVARKAKLVKDKTELAQGWSDVEQERESLRALSVDLQAKERAFRERARAQTGPVREDRRDTNEMEGVAEQILEQETAELELDQEERPQEDVDRWRTSDARQGFVLSESRVYLLARPRPAKLEKFMGLPPTYQVQLFGFPGGPLVSLVLLPDDSQPEDWTKEALFWTLDPGKGEDRRLLDILAAGARIDVEFYDEEARSVATYEVDSPLAENVKYLLHRADVQIESMDPALRDFGAAVEAYRDMGEDRLGRKQHNFSPESFQELPSPAAARLALGIVSYWSEPDNQDYLLLVKSFPITYWRNIRQRVINRALEFGLSLSPPLVDFALEQGLAKSREELLRTAVSNFAEVSLRIKPSDLDPTQEWENWKLLLADCVVEEVRVDPEIEELAAAAAKRASPEEDEASPGGDLSLLDKEELLPLLTDREMRRDAALELCERLDLDFLEPIFNAVCNMTRAEVARVLPAMIHFGDDAIPQFIQGLRHRKSFVRQGCALAMGALKAGGELEPLMDMLLSEPTNVWKEAARALGSMGPQALGALIAGVRSADGDGRERISWALAQVALTESGRSEVDAMANGRNARLAKVAERALDVLDQVELLDKEVRGEVKLAEQTIVRSFSRRFFDALSGEVSELSEADIVEQEDLLEEEILEESLLDDEALEADDLEEELLDGSELEEADLEEELLDGSELEEADDLEEELLDGSELSGDILEEDLEEELVDDSDVVQEELLDDDDILEEEDSLEDDFLDARPGSRRDEES